MANIKISELDELQEVADQDLFVIVDSDKNTTKKIQAGNLGILVPKTTKTTSDTETYSCNYVNGIVESGSNENGNWVKFIDGTMICYQSFTCNVNYSTKYGTGYYAEITNEIKSFPVSFIETPKVSIGLATNYGIGCALRDTNSEKCATNIFVYTFASRTDTITLNIIAIGKWK